MLKSTSKKAEDIIDLEDCLMEEMIVMSEEELININGIREDLYQAMQIGDITLNSKVSQELYDFMNYQDKEIERLNNIINGMGKFFQYAYDNEVRPLNDRKVSVWTICLDKLQELKGSNKE